VYVEADCDPVIRVSAIAQIISAIVVIHPNVIVFIPIASPVLRPRINEAEPVAAVLKAAISANIHHWETVDAEPVILTIVGTVTVIRNAIAVVSAALLPGAVLGLPVTRTVALPGGLLHACLFRAVLLCRPIAVLILMLLIVLFIGLLLLMLLVFLCIGLLLLLLMILLLILLLSGLLLLLLMLLAFLFIGLPLLLMLLITLLLLSVCLLLLLWGFSLLLLFRLGVLFLLLWFVLLVLACANWNSPSEKQKHCRDTNHSKCFHHFLSLKTTERPGTNCKCGGFCARFLVQACGPQIFHLPFFRPRWLSDSNS
jgi:hypothetical protein